MMRKSQQPHVLFLTFDQLSAMVLPLYGFKGVDTPNLDDLAARGVTFDHMISTCPVCTPYRSMWLTGRHPQSTGHVINTMTTRHDEIGWGDVFTHAGYDTGYIGKWHLHKGIFPENDRSGFYIPEGRDRLGFRWWRGYNLMASFFDGEYNYGDTGTNKRWEGYETEAMPGIVFDFIDNDRDPSRPFCLLVNPHQPHLGAGHRPDRMAPDHYYDRLPAEIPRPDGLDAATFEGFEKAYRHYCAMILAVDDMIGVVVKGLEERGLMDNTILVITSDHGTHMATHPVSNTNPFWTKKQPFETSVRVPLVVHGPGFDGGKRNDVLTAPVDLLPTFCGLCGIPVPSSIEGRDLSNAWHGNENYNEQDAVYMMNFAYRFSYPRDGWEWRGLRTKTHTYARYLTGDVCLFDNINDPFQQNNLVETSSAKTLEAFENRLQSLMTERQDGLHPGSHYEDWFDDERRVIRNASGPLSDPESQPDWSKLNS